MVAAVRQVLGEAGVRVRRADHREVLCAGNRDFCLGHSRVVGSDHAQELVVAQHLLDVLDARVSRVSGLAAVVEALEGDGEALDPARGVLLIDGELHAVLGRLAADRTDWQVGPDLDRALAPAACAAAAREGDEHRQCEDYESPSSNHTVPPCVYLRGFERFSPPPPLTRRPLPNLRRGESAPTTSAATWGGRPLLQSEL